jgi:hypothetical protein
MRSLLFPFGRVVLLIIGLGCEDTLHGQEPDETGPSKPSVQNWLTWYSCLDTGCVSVALRPFGFKPALLTGLSTFTWHPRESPTYRREDSVVWGQLDEHTSLVLVTDDRVELFLPVDEEEAVRRLAYRTWDPNCATVLQEQLRALGWKRGRLSSHWHVYDSPADPTLSVALNREIVKCSGGLHPKVTSWELYIKNYPKQVKR